MISHHFWTIDKIQVMTNNFNRYQKLFTVAKEFNIHLDSYKLILWLYTSY